jgi:nucleotide-binding universal stress UspA family protein
MNNRSGTAAIVVGVDGSQGAGKAVRWAIDEAISRNVPLRTVHVTGVDELPADEDRRSIEHAEMSLRAAAAVATRGSIGQFLESHAHESVQVAVLGENDVDQIAYLVWPQNHPDAQHGERSVLVVPHPLHSV